MLAALQNHLASPMNRSTDLSCAPLPTLPVLQVQLKKRGDDERYLAKVLSIGTECDVALLTGAAE